MSETAPAPAADTPAPAAGARRSLLRAALRRTQAARAQAPQGPGRPAADRSEPSPGQRRLWFLDQLVPGNTVYNTPFAYRLHGPLDLPALGGAFGELLRRHEVLRSNFTEADGVPRTVVRPFEPLLLEAEELAAPAAGATPGPAAEARWLEECVRQPFDLARDPLMRVRVARTGPGEHLLSIVAHHTVFDGWSQDVLLREIRATYGAAVAGETPDLPELPVQYADVAGRTDPAAEARDRAHWRGVLAGVPGPLELPTDFPRPTAPSLRGGSVRFAVAADTARRLRALAEERHATLFMTLVGAFQTLLGRYAGCRDVVIGTPMAGRSGPAAEALVGFFVNTVPLRADVGGDLPFRALVDRCRDMTLAAYEHQHLPYERLVEDLSGGSRSGGHDALVRAMFQIDTPAEPFHCGGLRWEALDVINGSAAFDLALSVEDRPDGRLTGELRYAAELFSHETAERMAAHLCVLLDAVAADPDRPAWRVPLWTPAEHALVAAANATAVPLSGAPAALHEAVAAQAARTPEAVAVEDSGRRLSYRLLDTRANALAHRLRAHGARPETLVGVCLERSADLVVALLAVLKSGAAFVPLDPDYPAERLRHMASDAAPAVVLTSRDLADGPLGAALAGAARRPALCLVDAATADGHTANGDGRTATADAPPAAGAGPDHLAYVMYTSGSTGRPKGAMNTHRAALNHTLWMADALGAEATSAVLHKTPPGFDPCLWEIFVPLVTGGRCVIARPGGHRDPRYLAGLIGSAGVTSADFVPSMLQAFLDSEGPKALAGLRAVVCGGEALPAALQDRLLGFFDGELFNMYGPTEAAVTSTWSRCRAGEAPHIGRPVWNTTAHVLSPDGDPVGFGLPGELCLGGTAVGRGYLGRPALTADRFQPDPGDPASRLYRTGDLVRWAGDGRLEYLGRTDHQVKIGGQRIEPGEIEAALLEHPSVREAVVGTFTDPSGTVKLVAHLTTAATPAGAALGTGDGAAAVLRDHLGRRLPHGWIPHHFLVLDALPLTPSGKLDRKALPLPRPGDRPAVVPAGPAPGTPAQRRMADIWSQVLGVAEPGIHDDFFALGGHSLQITRLVVRIEQATGVRLSVQSVFDHPTIAGLTELVAAAADTGTDRSRPVPAPRPARHGHDPVPLSHGQRQLWFVDRMQPGGTAYNVQEVLALPGDVDAGRLAGALSALVRRHQVLRTVFEEELGEPVLRVLPAAPVPLPVTDTARHPGADPAELLRTVADDEARTPFDLSTGPLLRARLLRLTPEESVLVLTLHHIVTDGWSMDLMVDELTELHHGTELPEPPLQYPDYAAWQRKLLAGPLREEQLAFWRRTLAGAPPTLDLPTDRVRPAVPSGAGGVLRFTVDAELTGRLRETGRQHGATLHMVLLAAFTQLLARHSGRTDIVVGTPVGGRTAPGLERIPGYFVNTVALRTDLSGDPDFLEVLRRVRATALAAYAHQDVPFEQVVADLHPVRDPAHHPVYQVVFELNSARPAASRPWARPLPVGVSNDTAKFDLTLFATESGDALDCGLRYATDVFSAEAAALLRDHWNALLTAAATAPATPTGAVPLDGAARRALLAAVNNTAVNDIVTDTVVTETPDLPAHLLVRRRARLHPDAVAVEWAGETLTYGRLDERVNRLAHRLAGAGAGPEKLVGVMLPRGLDLVVTLLAVWNTGAGFVPLDPELPAARLDAVVTGCRPVLLVTTPGLTAPAGPPALVPVPDGREDGAGPATPLDVTVHPDNRAYVVHTSGSTGTPKGIEGTHRGVVNYFADLTERGCTAPGDRVAALTTISFDAFLRDLLHPLTAGAHVVIVPGGGSDLRALARILQERRIQVLPALVPSLLRALTDELTENGRILPHLRTVQVSGEPLHPEDAARLAAAAPAARLVNMYGPSETTMTATRHPLPPAPLPPQRRIPVGTPIRNTVIEVLDDRMRPVPTGVPGRVHIGGAGLARGYLGNPALTASVFVPDPARPGRRLYDTGDLGRFLPDGTLQYLGRTDHQLKINGVRIDPSEVAACIAGHPAVAEAAVTGHQAGGTRQVLVGYLVTAAGHPAPTTAELRAHLAGQLPASLVPGLFVTLDKLPRTATGKIDRNRLPAPPAGALTAGRAARTTAEELIAGIWCEVLGTVEVGATDDFFALGGHSLLAARMAARAGEALGIEIPLRTVFEHPTVEALAAWADGHRSDPAAQPVPGAGRPADLAASQRRLWNLEQRTGRYAIYNVPVFRRLRGDLDTDALGAALSEVVRRHDALRTVFPAADGTPAPRIEPPAPVPLPLTALGAATPDAELHDRLSEIARAPFDLARGPLLRAGLLRLGPRDHILHVVIHHLVADGWSVGVFLRELTTLYRAFAAREPSPLAELPLQYADFASWQQRMLEGGGLRAGMDHWRSELAGLPALFPLPDTYPVLEGAERPPRGRTLRTLPPALRDRVASLGRQLRATTFMVLVSAYQAVLGHRFGGEDLAVAVPMANRDRAALDPLIGFVANMAALRARPRPDLPFADLVRATRERALDAYAHRDLPFELLLEELVPEQRDSHAPLVQALFNMQDFPHTAVPVPGLDIEHSGLNEVWVRYPITLFAHNRPDGILLDLVHDRELFVPAWAEDFLADMERLLTAAATDPGTTLGAALHRKEQP
ncbi:amino acid adenylation domain-containing protein [Streptomyces sp. NPDC012794]|uniref:amino acid adenylation domain-containing protein n=1 Tax=Streptomyces sp. NPDC012794 TaxID=3364850 RepID=UPI0036B4B59C